MILASAIMMAAATQAKPIETPSFEEVRVSIPARVRIVAGDSYSVNVTAKNEHTANAVRCQVEQGVLKINTRDIDALDGNAQSLRITIVTPNMPRLSTARNLLTTQRGGSKPDGLPAIVRPDKQNF